MMDGKPRKGAARWIVFMFCVISALGNAVSAALVSGVLGTSLYLDMVFTVAVSFAFGLWPGLVIGVLLYPGTNAVYKLLFNEGLETFWPGNVFILCTLSEVLLVCFFRAGIRKPPLPEEAPPSSFAAIAAPLMALAALDCVLVSLTGGIIDFVLYGLLSAPKGFYPEDIFKLGLYRNNVPVLAATVPARVPINIVDRFIAVFGGYGLSLLYRKAARG
jgi:hypothetical protein